MTSRPTPFEAQARKDGGLYVRKDVDDRFKDRGIPKVSMSREEAVKVSAEIKRLGDLIRPALVAAHGPNAKGDLDSIRAADNALKSAQTLYGTGGDPWPKLKLAKDLFSKIA